MSSRIALTAGIGIALLSLSVAQSVKTGAASQESSKTVFATLPDGPMKEKATTACTECHEARIVLQQRLSKAAWTKEVDKMIKWGAVVDASDRDALIDYLSSNFSPEVPPYDPPRSADGETGRQEERNFPLNSLQRQQSATDPVSRKGVGYYGSAAYAEPKN